MLRRESQLLATQPGLFASDEPDFDGGTEAKTAVQGSNWGKLDKVFEQLRSKGGVSAINKRDTLTNFDASVRCSG
jgi:hypothetical protein